MPRQQLNIQNINTLPLPADKSYIYYYDTVQAGLVLRINAGGKRVYMLRTRDNTGKSVDKILGEISKISLSAMRLRIKQYQAQIIMGEDPFVHTDGITLGEIYKKYVTWSEKHPAAPDANRVPTHDAWYTLKHSYERTPISDFENIKTTENWQQQQVAKKLQPSTINRISREIKFLIKWGKIHLNLTIVPVYAAPLSEISILPKRQHFTPAERVALLKSIDDYSSRLQGGRDVRYIKPLLILMMKTGLRPASALGLLWGDVDFVNNKINIRAANIKTRQAASVSLNNTAAAALTSWQLIAPGAPDDKIFPVLSIKKQFKIILTHAGIDPKKYSVYSLRHDFASELIAAGASLTDTQFCMCHSDPRTTLRYAQPDSSRKKITVDLIG